MLPCILKDSIFLLIESYETEKVPTEQVYRLKCKQMANYI